MATEIEQLRRRLAVLAGVCAEAYQLAGAVGAPAHVLDQLHAVADDRQQAPPSRHRFLL